MKNIFEGAKFRDEFLTKNGEIAIYQRYSREPDWEEYSDAYTVAHILFTSDKELMCSDDGTAQNYTLNDSIVSKYKEPIDEEKLDKLSQQSMIDKLKPDTPGEVFAIYKIGFEEGYRKAKEE